jgi:hypothetical protein
MIRSVGSSVDARRQLGVTVHMHRAVADPRTMSSAAEILYCSPREATS